MPVINGITIPNNPQQGAWYQGRQYWNGTLSEPGQINAQSNQQGAGQQVSKEVVAQTNPNNVAYVNQQTSQPTSGMGTAGSMMPSTARPTINLQNIYDSSMNSPDIQQATQKVTESQAKMDEQTQAFNDAQAIINDNPFYSEATRVGKVRQLQEKYNNDILLYQNQLRMANDNLTKKQADAQVKVNLAMQQYNIDDANYKAVVSQYNSALAAGAFTNASAADIAQMAQLTGMSTTMIDNIIKKQTKETAATYKPQLITATDDSGNMTVVAVNSSTGKIISTQSLGAIGGTKTGVSPDKYLSQAASIFKDVDLAGNPTYDAKGNPTGDQYLAKSEATNIYNRIAGLVPDDPALADTLFKRAWDSGGYQPWGQGW
jgi:hypothetical protein